jgi:hypothetical protein
LAVSNEATAANNFRRLAAPTAARITSITRPYNTNTTASSFVSFFIATTDECKRGELQSTTAKHMRTV